MISRFRIMWGHTLNPQHPAGRGHEGPLAVLPWYLQLLATACSSATSFSVKNYFQIFIVKLQKGLAHSLL